jgi:hypothetical protein
MNKIIVCLSFFFSMAIFSQDVPTCRPGKEPVSINGKWVCLPICPDNEVRSDNGECVCKPGFERVDGKCQLLPPAPKPVVLELPQPEPKASWLKIGLETLVAYKKWVAVGAAVLGVASLLGYRYWSTGTAIKQPSVSQKRESSVEQLALDVIRSGGQLFVGNGKKKLKLQTVKSTISSSKKH